MKTNEYKEQDYFYEDIIENLKNKVHLPIILENDVNASTVAEFRNLENNGAASTDLVISH